MSNYKPPRVLGTLNDAQISSALAAKIFYWLRKHGILNDKLEMNYDNERVTFTKHYPIVYDDNGFVLYKPTRHYQLGDFMDTLIRLDRARWSAFKGAERQQGQLIKTMQKHLDAMRGVND